MLRSSSTFREIWSVDFEFSAPAGERPKVVCLVALELISGREIRLWQDEISQLSGPPYSIGPDTLFIAYYASAEIGCHLSLGWDLPVNVLDLFVEFRNATNGLTLPCGQGLLGALAWCGLPAIDAAEKESMRELAQRQGGWTEQECIALLDYCASDVYSLQKLLLAMEATLDLPRALLRGRYMKAAACIEHHGIPIDVPVLEKMRAGWGQIQDALVVEIDQNYGVYEGRTFKTAKFERFLELHDVPWPRLASGRLDLTDDTFKQMSRSNPLISPLRELRYTLSQMRLTDLSVGHDGQNRCLLSAFRARTGRNQPSNSRFIFGPSVWLRSLVKPAEGCALAYLDYSQQEFGIAAALSGDLKMQDAYLSGDPYLEFAKQAGAVPPDATKKSHKAQREQFKACVLAVQYGMGEESLAARINQSVARSRELLRLHRKTYQQFWCWSAGVVDYAMLHGRIWTVFGWQVQTGSDPNPRFLQNFPMQANGAEMLRLACCLMVEQGINVCAPVHDAVLIEGPVNEIEAIVLEAQEIMAAASEIVLGGFRLRSDVNFVRYPDRYVDERGIEMWDKVVGLLEQQGERQCNNQSAQPHTSSILSISIDGGNDGIA